MSATWRPVRRAAAARDRTLSGGTRGCGLRHLTAAGLVVGLGAAGALVTAQDGALVGPWPEVTELAVGQERAVTIRVRDITALYGADVRLEFDPTVIEVMDADPEQPGVQVEFLDEFLSPDWILVNAADNVDGTVWYAATQVNPSVPVTGTGDLARITFRGLAPGTSAVTVTYRKLVLRTGAPIEVGTVEAHLHVSGGGPTRTPPPTRTVTPLPTATPEPTVTGTRATATSSPTEAVPTDPPTAVPTRDTGSSTIWAPFVSTRRR